MKNSYSSQMQRDSMFPRALLIYIIILVGAADALDVPFVFGETTSSVAGYTPGQFEKVSQASPDLAGVPSASVPSENETLKFPIVGGSNTPVGANEKKVADLKKHWTLRCRLTVLQLSKKLDWRQASIPAITP
jgi:hypothetical protein